jgi:cyclohexyl-isocyanide hydratase
VLRSPAQRERSRRAIALLPWHVITGGGVTAGIDMALTVMAEIAGVDFAQTVQLAIEYAPAPPFDSGRPERARPEIVETARFGPQ